MALCGRTCENIKFLSKVVNLYRAGSVGSEHRNYKIKSRELKLHLQKNSFYLRRKDEIDGRG